MNEWKIKCINWISIIMDRSNRFELALSFMHLIRQTLFSSFCFNHPVEKMEIIINAKPLCVARSAFLCLFFFFFSSV